MKKYYKEFIILSIQLIMFYIVPIFILSINPVGMVLMLLLTTLVLSAVLGKISKEKIKYVYPIIISILFIPSVFIYYNETALMHSLWYLIDSYFGILIGSVIFK